jgi:hypothetical protein
MRILDKAEDVPFFVAKTLLFPLGGEHPSKGTREVRNIPSFLKLSLL